MPASSNKFGLTVETITPGTRAAPITPGDFLRNEIRGELEITQARLAEALGVSRHSVNEIEGGRRSITPEMAIRLGCVLGTSAEFWLNLQRDVDLFRARRSLNLSQLTRGGADLRAASVDTHAKHRDVKQARPARVGSAVLRQQQTPESSDPRNPDHG